MNKIPAVMVEIFLYKYLRSFSTSFLLSLLIHMVSYFILPVFIVRNSDVQLPVRCSHVCIDQMQRPCATAREFTHAATKYGRWRVVVPADWHTATAAGGSNSRGSTIKFPFFALLDFSLCFTEIQLIFLASTLVNITLMMS